MKKIIRNIFSGILAFTVVIESLAVQTTAFAKENQGTLMVGSNELEDFTISRPADVVYNGKEQKQSVRVENTLGEVLTEGVDYKISYSYIADDQSMSGEQAPVNAGLILVSLEGKGSYVGHAGTFYSILPAPLRVDTDSAQKQYDGTPLTAGAAITGLVNGETVSIESTASITDVGRTLNTYRIKWDETAEETNYQITEEDIGTLTITPGVTERNGINAEGYHGVYDGREHLITAEATLPGSVLTYSTDGGVNWTADVPSFKDATDEEVRVRIRAKNSSYEYGTAEVEVGVKIDRARLTVYTDSARKSYDGKPLSAPGRITGLVGEETVGFETTGSRTEVGVSRNTYRLDWSGTEAAGANPANEFNYTVETGSIGFLTVSRAETELTIQAESKVFDGAPVEPIIISNRAEEEIEVSYYLVTGDGETLLSEAPKDAGGYRVVVTAPKSDQYWDANAESCFTIEKRQIAISLSVEKNSENPEGADLVATISNGIDDLVSSKLCAQFECIFEGSTIPSNYLVEVKKKGDAYEARLTLGTIPVGNYSVKSYLVFVSGQPENYSCDPTVKSFEKKYKDVTLTVADTEKELDAEAFTLYATVMDANGKEMSDPAVTFALESGNNISITANGTVTIKGAGEALVRVDFPGNEFYNPASAFATVTVKKGTIGIVTQAESKVYDGTPAECSARIVYGADRYPVVYSGTPRFTWYVKQGETWTQTRDNPVSAGVYKVEGSADADKNFNATTSVLHGEGCTFTISKMNPIVSDFTYMAPTDLVYDGNAKIATVISSSSIEGIGEVTVNYYGDAACITEIKPKNIGTYYVGITAAEGDNYKATTSALHDESWKFTIGKANAAAATVTANNRTYDGTDKPLVTVTGEAIGGTMYYAVTTENMAPTDDSLYSASIPAKTNAGTYYVWYKVVADSNHLDSIADCVLVSIAKREVTVSVENEVVTYDGSSHNGKTSYIFQNIVEGDAASISYTPSSGISQGTYSNGNFDAASFMVMHGNNDITVNYSLTTKTAGTLVIHPKPIVVVADAKYRALGAKDPQLTYTVTGLIGGDSLSGVLTREEGEKAGSYAILQGTLTAGSNYVIHYVGAALSILEEDYLDQLRRLLNDAIALGGSRTVTWEKGTGLPSDIMKILQEHPQITLIFKYYFGDRSYEVTIRGKDVVLDPSTPWYGPLNLFGCYGLTVGIINPSGVTGSYRVVRGDNLTKIARRFNTTVAWLVKVNLIKNPNLIWANQILKY
jgi:hypothetical protein